MIFFFFIIDFEEDGRNNKKFYFFFPTNESHLKTLLKFLWAKVPVRLKGEPSEDSGATNITFFFFFINAFSISALDFPEKK